MRLQVSKLGGGLNAAVFMWEDGHLNVDGKFIARKKVVQTLGLNDCLDVDDIIGHRIIAQYPQNFKVVHYGDGGAPIQKKQASSPKTAMVKEETTKDVPQL